ncbi:3-hydroxyacyl-CoA dehydrogenase family protein, partial [Streptomyces sp. NPDC087850]|uniref:3-hydroxyacyl-CoA dehydrogenase family protein n=1 Tax=Streptomyces sp. NPDC087850 TaxID=3365809 RepID=UPI003816B814
MVEIIGVVGAGTIGRGVAHSAAEAGYRVLLVDISEQVLQDAIGRVRKEARSYRLLGSRGEKNRGDVVARIETTCDYGRLAEADFVVENVVEDMEVKRTVYRELDRVCGPDVVLAANTSAVPVTAIGSWTQRPEQVLGIHFMNPVPVKKTVELIRGARTSEKSLATAQEVLTSLGKDWVLVEDSPGFVSNRVLILAVNEAAFLVQERVASVED